MKTAIGISLLWFSLAFAGLSAGGPETWIPARWDGGPLEVAHRAKDKALANPNVRDAISRWYEPATLALLDGMPVNCLLVTFSGGDDADLVQRQQRLVKEYARKARERGLAVLGLVYPGSAGPSAIAKAAAEASLDGVVLEGEFPGGVGFADQVRNALRPADKALVVIPAVSSAAPLRKADWPVAAVEGVPPGVGKPAEGATASATAGVWVDSNMWLVRSFRLNPVPRPVWLSHRVSAPAAYLKSIADAAATGGHWIVALDDDLRVKAFHRDASALAVWQGMGNLLAFFAEYAEWRKFAPFGTVGIILDNAGQHLDNSEEFLNLVARRQIPYRVVDRSQLSAASLADLRAVLAFDLAPPAENERKILRDFAAQGGLVLGGPSWGAPPKEQSYAVAAVEQGEVAVYKDYSPDPESVARDLNDLLTSDDFGVSVFDAPSVLSYVSTDADSRMLIQMVNYADRPADSFTVWVNRKLKAARFHIPGKVLAELPLRSRGARTEITVPNLAVYGALLLE